MQTNIPSRTVSFLKAISWRIVGTIDTIVVSYFITGKIKTALSIGTVEVVTKITVYYLHERAWVKILGIASV
jgi:uncharacterized membrane protein